MITRQTKIQLMVFALISIVGLTFTGLRYAGLGKYVSDQGYLVSADFVDSGGIFQGAEVTYRGVAKGKVEKLELREDGVRVFMRLRPGTQVPDAVKANVGNRSAVGEQFVDLVPQRDGAPFLAKGAVIPQAMTSIPVSPTQLVVNLDDFVTSIDVDDLAIVLDELGKAFDQSGDSLQRLVDSGNLLTQAATDALPETRRLIRDGVKVLNTQRDTGGQFRSFNADLADLSAQIRTSDPDFRRLFANGRSSAVATTSLIEANRSALPVLLSNLITVAQVQQVRLPQLRQTLVTYPNVVAGGFTVVPDDGTTHFGLVSDMQPPPCETGGYAQTKERSPQDVKLQTPNLNAFCGSDNPAQTVRGARNAPRPNGQQPFGGGSSAAAAAQASAAPKAAPASADSVLLGDYDPVTGNVVTSTGQRLTLANSGGASALFGGSSWQWLLLGPLAQ